MPVGRKGWWRGSDDEDDGVVLESCFSIEMIWEAKFLCKMVWLVDGKVMMCWSTSLSKKRGLSPRRTCLDHAPPWPAIIPLFSVIFSRIFPAPLSTSSPAMRHPHSSASASVLT